jgi:hypothetical protein
MRCKPVTVSTDIVNAAYLFNEADCGNTVCNPAANGTSAITVGYTASASIYPHYMFRPPNPLLRTLQTLSYHLLGEGPPT